MIIGVNATSGWVQCGSLLDEGAIYEEWDGRQCIEELPCRLHSLVSTHGALTGALVILGPGSYTGIRLSLTTLKMMTLVHNVPLVGWSLFDGYMALNHAIIQGLVVLTSPSRKGMLNLQVFQSNATGYASVSSLLQVSFTHMAAFLRRFESPVYWHSFGDDDLAIESDRVTPHRAHLNVLDLLRHQQSTIASMDANAGSLSPIYSCPPVV